MPAATPGRDGPRDGRAAVGPHDRSAAHDRQPTRLAAAYCVLVGLGMLGIWGVLILSGAVGETERAPIEIALHLVAETVTALALLGAGVGRFRGWAIARPLYPVALGMLGYTVVNSAGYYASLGETPMVVTFALLAGVTAILLARHLGAGHGGWPFGG